METPVVFPDAHDELAADIRTLIEAARLRVAQTVNQELVLLNWQIGNEFGAISSRKHGQNTVTRLSLHCRDN